MIKYYIMVLKEETVCKFSFAIMEPNQTSIKLNEYADTNLHSLHRKA